MTRRALVTGGTGFVGQWLVRSLLADEWTVFAAAAHPLPVRSDVLAASDRRRVRWLETDVRRTDDVRRAVDASLPDAVFHLAGITYVPEANEAPEAAYDVNVLGAVRLLCELAGRRRAGALDPTILIVGSGTQYGRHESAEMPLTESAPQRPLGIYGASKAAQELAALQMQRADGLRLVCVRSFNHSGPGHAAHFLLPALVQRVLALRDRPSPTLRLGNQGSVRDYLHVSDVVAAYRLLSERGNPGEVYNVCSGEGVSVRQLAEDVLLRVGIAADISTDPELVRADDVPVLVGSPAKLQRDTGWQPARTRTDIIDDLIHAATY